MGNWYGKNGQKSDTRHQQNIHVKGVDNGGTATTIKTTGIEDNRKFFVSSPRISRNVFVIPLRISTNGNIFMWDPRNTDVTSPRESWIKYDKVDDRSELTSKGPLQCCPGKKKPCGARLSFDQSFCTQCKWEVDKSIFNTEEMICTGRNEDGSPCNASISEGFRFCPMCGERVLEGLVFPCSGKTSEGVACDYWSSRSFDTCPKCNSDSKPRGIRRETSCPGEKHPCGNKLTVDDEQCPKCHWKVNKELFFSENRCKRLTENESLCMAQIKDEDIFCSKCGNGVSKDPVRQSLILSPDPLINIPEEVKSRWVLSNVKIGDYLITIMHHSQQALMKLFMFIHQTYQAICYRIDDGSLVFTFLHETTERAQEMIDDKENVKRLLATFLEELDASVLYDHLDLTVELLTDQMKEVSSVETLEANLPAHETKKTDIRSLSSSTQVRAGDGIRMETTIQDLQPFWSKQSQSLHQIVGQRSTASQQPSRSDVTKNVHQSAREETSDARTSNTEAGTRKKDELDLSKTTGEASESAETRRMYNEGVKDTLCILDSQGQALEPGDALWIRDRFGTWAVYVGNQEVVHCRRRDLMVVKEELAMTRPFGKLTVRRGECQVFPPRQRVDRATAWIGRKFEEGDLLLDGLDFLTWVYTGLGYWKACRKGFGLYRA